MSRRSLVLSLPASLLMLACASEPPGPGAPVSATQTAPASEAEAQVSAAVRASALASGADAQAVLSGSAPPPAPSASASAASMSSELAELDLKVLAALNEPGAAQAHVFKDGEVPQPLDAAMGKRDPGPGAGLNLGGGGGLAAVGDSGGGSKPAETTIAGTALSAAGHADVAKALTDAGCTSTRLDSPTKSGKPRKAIFLAKCGERSFTVTFVPAGADAQDATQLAEMSKGGARLKEGEVVLAVKPAQGAGDPAASKALLDKLVKRATPKGLAQIGGASVTGGAVSNASAVVAGMAAGLRRCYMKGLAEDPEMKGTVRVVAKIGPAGEVLSATPGSAKGLSGKVTSCVAGVVLSRQFAAPEGGAATLTIPISFTPAQ